LQTDATQKVSIVVHSIGDKLTPLEFEFVDRAQKEGKTSDWLTPRKESSWEEVAIRLDAPVRPELPRLARINRSNRQFIVLGGWVIGYAIFILVNPMFGNSVLSILLAIVLLVAPLIVMSRWLAWANREREKLQEKISIWGQAKSKWSQLWYCARDDGVFIAGQRRLIPAEQTQAFIYE
jgi:hypothetical protein